MNNLSLVRIANEVSQLEEMLLMSEGAITPEIENILTIKETALPEKIDGYSLMLERLEYLETMYKERAKMFATAGKSFANAQETLKERLKYAMKEMGVTELCGNDIRFKMSATKPKLVIDDETLIPKDYRVETVIITLSKDKLTEDLKIGEVPGARLEQSSSLRTYVNSATKKKEVQNV